MKIELFGKNYDPSDALKQITEKKSEKLARRLKGDPDATAKFNVTLEGDKYTTDLLVVTRSIEYRAENTSDDPFTNVDIVIPKILAQMEKQKDIWGASKKGTPNEYPEEDK
ncbi:MAG: HPF/RaiA family ribosome-associated protein [Clostridia bacterium]|nr:HPF/RaiA family ribosome-associated protein [Clostridia bacterium]